MSYQSAKALAITLALVFVWVCISKGETKAKPERAMVTGLVEEIQAGSCKGRGCVLDSLVERGKVKLSLASGCNTVLDYRIATGRREAPAGYRPIKPGVWRGIRNMAKRFGYVEVSCLETGHSYYVAGTNNVSDHSVGGGADFSVIGKTRINTAMQLNRPRTIRLVESICRKSGAWQMVGYRQHNLPGSIGMGNHKDHVHCGWR